MRPSVVLALTLALVAGAGAELRGQDRPGARRTLSGTVTDSVTGLPVLGAAVSLGRALALTDSAGGFVLRRVMEGPQTLEVEQLGYESAMVGVDVAGGTGPISIRLRPDPAVLEAITVMTDRFRRARNMSVMSVRAIERKELLASGVHDMHQFLELRTNLTRVACGPGRYCAFVRGSVTPVSLWIDDRRAFPEELHMYRPQDIFVLELYGGGRIVRLFTNWWLESAAGRTPVVLPY